MDEKEKSHRGGFKMKKKYIIEIEISETAIENTFERELKKHFKEYYEELYPKLIKSIKIRK